MTSRKVALGLRKVSPRLRLGGTLLGLGLLFFEVLAAPSSSRTTVHFHRPTKFQALNHDPLKPHRTVVYAPSWCMAPSWRAISRDTFPSTALATAQRLAVTSAVVLFGYCRKASNLRRVVTRNAPLRAGAHVAHEQPVQRQCRAPAGRLRVSQG